LQIVFTNNSQYSPWPAYLKDSTYTVNRSWFEMMTLTQFPLGITFLVPQLVIAYFRTGAEDWRLFKYHLWAVWLVIMNILPPLLFLSYWWSLDPEGNLVTWAVPIELYSFIVLILCYASLLYLLVVQVRRFFLWRRP
jgi:hypothetical protein